MPAWYAQFLDAAGHVGGIFAGVVAVFFTAVRARETWFSGSKTQVEAEEAAEKVKEDDRAELVKIKDEIITALREQNAELKRQVDASIERERTWQRERAEMKRKLETLEREYRELLHGIVEGDWCGKARRCGERTVPGDRRQEETALADVSPGGTD